MTHFMVDSETWGNYAGCELRSIGVVPFNPITGEVYEDDTFYRAVQCDAWEGVFQREQSTVDWWAEQSDEAQAAFADPVPITQAFDELYDFMRFRQPDVTKVRFWAHGPHYDFTIIDRAVQLTGSYGHWSHRSPRDTRTIFEAADMDPYACLDLFDLGGVKHHARDDALCQARAVCAAYRVIQTNKVIIHGSQAQENPDGNR